MPDAFLLIAIIDFIYIPSNGFRTFKHVDVYSSNNLDFNLTFRTIYCAQCWDSILDGGPTLRRDRANVSCLMGSDI